MMHQTSTRVPLLFRLVVGVLAVAASVSVIAGAAQRGGQQGAPAGPPSAWSTAPLDLEGYWVSVVTEDWRWRMMTPPRGDAPGVPLSLEGRRVANAWDLAKDNAAGNQCKAFGAGGIMRIPGRIHITWENDSTLKLEFDAGRQTRLVHFGAAPRGGEPTLQGHSTGSWQTRTTGRPILDEEAIAGRGRGAARDKGSLKIVTTGMRAGYFRKNGLPYGETATLTEYFDRHDDFGSQWFTVLSVLEDSRYLISPFVTTTHFKREPNGAKWNPQACETLPPTTNRVSRGEDI
jgi:hypothetical protein